MNTIRSARPAHLIALLLIGSLAACAPGSGPTPSPTNSPSETSTSDPSTSPTTGPTTEPTGSPTPSETPTAGPAIVIESPAEDARVTVPVTASGTANTFEASFMLQLLTEVGDTLCVRHVMATSGSGTEGTWQTDLAFVPPDADQPAILRAFEISAENGTPINIVDRNIVVTAERPPIIIGTPVCGDVVAPGGLIAVTGRALVFEAQLSLELRDAAGTPVLRQEVTAESGTEESNFSAMVTVPAGTPGGYYDLVAFDNSAKDGSIQHEFPVQILVQ